MNEQAPHRSEVDAAVALYGKAGTPLPGWLRNPASEHARAAPRPPLKTPQGCSPRWLSSSILDRMDPRTWGQRCSATSKRTRQPCGCWAIKGGYVCWHHGGAIKRVRAAADRRWAEALATRATMDRMAATLERHGQASAAR